MIVFRLRSDVTALRRNSALGLSLLALLYAATSASAQRVALPPDSVAAEFQTAIRVSAWRAAARRMHPEALRRIHRRIEQFIEVDTTGQTLEAIFGSISEAEFWALSSSEVFVRVMEAISRDIPGLLHFLVIQEIEMLGTVEEPPELAHVVYRSTLRLSGAEPEIRVMTLKRSDEGWRVLASQELDVIREAARGFLLREEPPPPNPAPSP
ncbi:MAG: hypothetical protein AMS25_09155 [Gemmatimonas sp. SM23_52]|nr:MAG: hypothetical protein AMS25_09155 [Gemmatimonas sp. SM23_52]